MVAWEVEIFAGAVSFDGIEKVGKLGTSGRNANFLEGKAENFHCYRGVELRKISALEMIIFGNDRFENGGNF